VELANHTRLRGEVNTFLIETITAISSPNNSG
jgi:hypothetical protein